MASIPFALSVHHFISSVGADAGFASLIGLALLILLYFAHARETATLRSRADEAGLRVQELEGQLADLADQVAALPAEISVRATGPRVALAHDGIQQHAVAGVGASAGSQVPFPGAPAGVGAPALASATRMIPMPDPRTVQPEPASAPAAATVAGATNGSGRIPVAAGAGTVQRPAQTPAGAPPRPPAGPGRGVGGPGRAGGPITGQPRPVGAGQRPITGQPRAGGPSNARRPGGPGGPSYVPVRAERRLSMGRVGLAVAVAALGAAAIVAAVLVLTHKGSVKTPSQSSVSSSLTSHRSKATTTVVRPATVTVSVLNGTDLTGLAGHVADKLAAVGFPKGAVTDATNQTQTTSIVGYLLPADRADALAVAAALKLKASSVQRVDPNTKSVACSFAPAGCNSPVYVTVGSDLSSQ